MTTPPDVLFLAQLLDQPASETRRTALPTEAFAGSLRYVYRAVLAAANDHPVVSVEAVVAELAESGRLQEVGGRDAVEAIGDHIGAQPIDGARADLVSHAVKRLLEASSRAVVASAREGRTREALDEMQAVQRLVVALQGASHSVALKSMREHIGGYVQAAAAGERKVAKAKLPAFGRAFAAPIPGAMVMIYGFSQSGKSFAMQYLEARYAEAGYPTLRVSCEDPDSVNAGRLVSEACDIDASVPGDLRREDWQRILSRTGSPEDAWDLRYVVEHTSSAEAIAQTIRTASAQVGVKVAFVDYAQLLRVASVNANDNQEARIAAAGAMLKEVAKECGVYLLCGSQVTVRDPKPGKVYKPSPFDMKGCRALYEMAEQGIALWVDQGTGDRFAEIQKDKITGCNGQIARVVVGKAGVIRDLIPIEKEQQQPQRSGGRYANMYGRGEFQDAG